MDGSTKSSVSASRRSWRPKVGLLPEGALVGRLADERDRSRPQLGRESLEACGRAREIRATQLADRHGLYGARRSSDRGRDRAATTARRARAVAGVMPASASSRQKSLRGFAKWAPAAAERRPGLMPQKTQVEIRPEDVGDGGVHGPGGYVEPVGSSSVTTGAGEAARVRCLPRRGRCDRRRGSRSGCARATRGTRSISSSWRSPGARSRAFGSTPAASRSRGRRRPRGVISRRDEDGLYAFVEIELVLDVAMDPPPAARGPGQSAGSRGARVLHRQLADRCTRGRSGASTEPTSRSRRELPSHSTWRPCGRDSRLSIGRSRSSTVPAEPRCRTP